MKLNLSSIGTECVLWWKMRARICGYTDMRTKRIDLPNRCAYVVKFASCSAFLRVAHANTSLSEIPALSQIRIPYIEPLRKTNKLPYQKLKGFKIGQLNIASLFKHIEELRIFMQYQTFDILSINETRLDNTIYSDEVKITGYDLIRKDRKRSGGAVAIYVRRTIPYIDRNDLLTNNAEAICLEKNKPKTKALIISTWYRPPSASIELLE